jgi:hypothetical protein
MNEARVCYDQALSAIGFLPVRIRELAGTTELVARVRAGLERLGGKVPTVEVNEGSSRPSTRAEVGRQ